MILAGHGRTTVGDQEIHYEAGDTVILPARTVHQVFAESTTELLSAMPLADPIRTPAGEPLELPWRR